MIEEDQRLMKTTNVVLGHYQLCVECESYLKDYTGKDSKAVRQVTPEGRCATCGSKSLVRLPEHKWPWQRKEAQ